MNPYAKAAFSIALASLAQICGAHAAWDFSPDTDPMTDEKTAYVSVDDDNSAYALGFKCWDDAENTRWIAFITDIEFSQAKSYPEAMKMAVRIDAERPMEVALGQVNLGNKLAYVTSPEIGKAYFNLENKILGAKSRIVTEFMVNQVVFKVPNTQHVMQQMSAICPYLGR